MRETYKVIPLPLSNGNTKTAIQKVNRYRSCASDDAILDIDRELRIRAHRARVEREMRELGIFDECMGNALKMCCVEGCLRESISAVGVLLRLGWRKCSRGLWYCPEHAEGI